jgi:hypothetical protein
MSWKRFKGELLPQMNSFTFGKDSNKFAKALTRSYDFTIKSGYSNLTAIPLIYGNVEGMETTLIQLLQTTKLSSKKTILDVIGPAVIQYWSGASLYLLPPIIPAPMTLRNIAVTSAPILNAGKWTNIVVPPNSNSEIFLNAFIQSAKLHLTTVTGAHFCISQYPPPAAPSPAVLPFTGYYISE